MLKHKLQLSLWIALAIILHIIEGMLPTVLIIPGAKLGLTNIITLFVLVAYGFKSGLAVLLIRILISSLLTGVFFTPGFWLSLTGGITSFLVMGYLYYYQRNRFSVIGISVLGAAFHNLGQTVMAYILIGNWRLLIYLPYLLLLALPTGLFVGLAVLKLEDHLETIAVG